MRTTVINLLLGLLVLMVGCTDHTSETTVEADVARKTEFVILCPNIFASTVKEILPGFEKANPDCGVKLVVHPIRPMLNDITAGKTTGDVFLSVGDVELSHLYKNELAIGDTERPLAKTTLVAVARKGNPLALNTLEDIAKPEVERISVPDPEFNSGGKAFIQAAKKLDIHDDIEERLVFAPGPRSATKILEEEKADVAVTHKRCFAGHAKANALVQYVSSELHEPIVCRAVVLTASRNRELAAEFIDFLRTEDSRAHFKEALFEPLD
jgi:molybdate transport system substrate-binding protein